MRDVTIREDRVLGLTAWYCSVCKQGQYSAAGQADPPLDEQPSDTEPGSPARQAVYADRARRGRAVFHPGDRQPTPGSAVAAAGRGHLADPQRRCIRYRHDRRVYAVRIQVDGRQVHVGCYPTLELALAARDRAEARAGRRAA